MTGKQFEKLTLTTDVLPPFKRSGRGKALPERARSTNPPPIRPKASTGLLRAILRFVGLKRG